MLKNVLVFIVLCFFTNNLKAQFSCGTDDSVLREDITQNRPLWSSAPRNGATQFVPIKFHLIGKTDGTGAIGASDVLEQLCFINKIYAPDIQFYLADGGYDYTFNDECFDLKTTAALDKLIKNINKNVANIYLMKSFKLDGQFGAVPGVYEPLKDVILIQVPSLKSAQSTIAHELGHLLGLAHPYVTTGNNDFSMIKANDQLPAGTECMNGTNCKTSGDRLCDTPPDVLGFFTFSDDCKSLPFTVFDACGDSVRPILNLLMSYRNCDKYVITKEQSQVMDFTLNFGKKQKYDKSFTGSLPISGFVKNGSTLVATQVPPILVDKVTFKWEAVKNAYGYILQVSPTSNFSFLVSNVFTNNSNQYVELPLGKTYYWRVLAFTETTCLDWSNTTKWVYATGVSSSNELHFVNDFSIYPNPAQDKLSFQSSSDFSGQLELYNLQGQSVLRQNITQASSVQVGHLPQGVYLAKISKENVLLKTEKIILLQ